MNTKEYYQVNMDFWTQINQKEEVRKIIASHYDQFRVTARSIIEDGMKNNFRKVDSNNTAIMILGMLDGISLQWLFDAKSIDLNSVKETTKQMIFNFLES